ncbi:hypothetical protein B566_EDAN010875 [Ephemera danica]|nr:hypothetical protein B566_EDAN010875 [Ephemera danica]
MEIAESLLQAIPHIEDKDWFHAAWDAELMTLPDPPEELEEISTETTKLLGRIAHAMRKEVVNIQDQNEGGKEKESNQESIYGLWDALRTLELDYRQMLPVLCYFISNGTNNFEDTDLRNLGLQATSCYFLLLSVPGSVTYNMYHSIMFTHGLNTLKLAVKICVNKKKPTKRSKNSEKSTENEEEEQEEEERLQLSESQRLELLSQLKVGLRLMCSQLHGRVDECVTTVMEHIFGVLTNTHQSLSLDLAPRELNVTRENAFNFAMYLVKDLGKPAWNGVSILFQHILTRFTEKAENRLRCAQLASQLLNGVPTALRNKLCTWIWALGHAEKPAYRLMALELASHLLHEIQFEHADPDAMETNEEQQEQPDEEQGAGDAEKVDAETGEEAKEQEEEGDGEERSPRVENQKRQSNSEKFALRHSHFLLLVLYRCDDQAPTVRAKALSAVGELAANLNQIADLVRIILSLLILVTGL